MLAKVTDCRERDKIFTFAERIRNIKYGSSAGDAAGKHLTSPGYSLSDLSITILGQVNKKENLFRKQKKILY